MAQTSDIARRLVVCADDYGISPAVSAGIRELATKGRISATGVMALMPFWPDDAAALAGLRRDLDGRLHVGLHLTFTDQQPLGDMPILAPDGKLPSVGALLRRVFTKGLPEAEVAAEITRQIDTFEAHFGHPPDFIDGHQHVHVLPVVRDQVLNLFGTRLDPRKSWLRDCWDRTGALLRRPCSSKAIFIARLSRALHEQAERESVRTNKGFSGFYDFFRADFPLSVPRMMSGIADGHLLMVHPGHVDPALCGVDSLTTPRQAEWNFLMSERFDALLQRHRLVIGPLF